MASHKILLILFLYLTKIVVADVICESFDKEEWYVSGKGYQKEKTCGMRETTQITSENVKIDSYRDESMKVLDVSRNKQIEYLPVKISDSFPNLIRIQADSCSIKKISKENFEKLDMLRVLSLAENQIEKIPTSTFQGLSSLEHLYLGKNKIMFLNGEAFKNLNNLRAVDLHKNSCIDKDFTVESIRTITTEVSEKCRFKIED